MCLCDELDELAGTLNLMLKRIQGYVRELSHMMGNTAHDFKTPLGRIRSLAEKALMDTDPENIQGNLVQVVEETDRFLSLIKAVLSISAARTGILRLHKDRVGLGRACLEGACREKAVEG
ncbi:His Kinase A (phospho-acceptor) domain-containing protein [Desulfacinum hydrothermale DSM 13146]|uniref:histidine kinase n=1 Tax=Desulfacinum hydrothermale DSM 13146 TaxID=1121390 RepID=A0A1W1XNP0_9BACT|nr:histidine kinase dimerization/phospho-acceptor domain-containing protein [Desulfacinum hydrothermale]SMC25465.1 His Kinase A (phospho-acceptor) domain-containing protein [Desulfacinum hydrothermale DSM 13146]